MVARKPAVSKSAGVLKRPSAANAAFIEEEDREKDDIEMGGEEEEADEEQEEAEGEVSEEDKAKRQQEEAKRQEEELVTLRRRELKAMAVADVKTLVEKAGLEAGNKADMVEGIVSHEARVREEKRAHAVRVREIVVQKKEELESLPVSELTRKCSDSGIRGNLTKKARVELLLKQWQEADGVGKGLKDAARRAREEALLGMDRPALQAICEKAGVQAFVTEVLVDRILRREDEAGRFAKPVVEDILPEQEDGTKKGKKRDLVDALLENEENRKVEAERKKQEAEVVASKRKELRAMSVEELKKQLSGKGCDAVGKKDELVELLFAKLQEEDAAAAKKGKLRALGQEDLRKLVAGKGLEVAGKKEAMVEALIAHEAKMIREAQQFAEHAKKAEETKKEELESKTASELKDLCTSKGLKSGLSKPDRIERLVEHARASGEIDRIVALKVRGSRRDLLLAMEKAELLRLSESLSVDTMVKEVAIERILAHEEEHGVTQIEPSSKKARRS